MQHKADGTILLNADALEGHTDRVNVVKVDWDRACAVTGAEDDTVRVWNLSELTCDGTLSGHERGVRDVSVDFEDQMVFSASDDMTLRLWDISSMRCKGIL